MSFEDLGLEPTLLKAIAEAGYETPTPIQKAAIPEALAGRDVLGIAQTGTGKTASFTLPMIQRLSKGRARARMPRSLVLAPTRELAAQVADNFEKYGKHHKLSMALLIGGVSFADQDAKLTRGVDVLIATPGRLLDHFERGRLLLTGIEVMVVDEADRMLDMGFIPDIERIFKLTPITRQTLFFSATMPPEIQRITDMFLHRPARIEVAKPATAASTIAQRIVRLETKADNVKRAALRKLLDREDVKNGIIFCNRKATVDVVAKSLQKHGYNARPIHGDLAQAFRTETLDKFRSGELKFLVASDVAARGLDIPDVSHVFNFDVPIHAEDYVHRIGRTGRAGRQGATFMIVTPADAKYYDAILKTIRVDAIEALDIEVDVEPREREGRLARGVGRRRRDRPDRGEKSGRAQNRRSERARPEPIRQESEQEARAAEPRRRDEARRNGAARRSGQAKEAVVGLGDHVPAFLLR
ncbi:DEAD/DEAH box helicase [Amphiplicatus metriothermophilus]|uniref:DEAD-box ATP-dependent RNA helicase RhpA n=1 Tax=Amphiplicatus metriothermophilus TaxID=1519374 RepID=A0A239PTM4_9PROT|nr:DEAD/DEAH box helicase [Amphiplicatus metriothermophilus]MBB5519314.1 superfamily II DNA/RNA helicase [Amphiplicatus metriothermophilus]SNT73383.1 Superfamily II DNA and RNA helicase [Amphiplicatus metriothermophilus]